MPLSREHQDQREWHKVKDFQAPGWSAALRLWQIKIMKSGRYCWLILHILTHGSRCVVSAWIPVGNYLSASAHWCHSFPVITQSPACQGQVTSRWAWLVLNWTLPPILPHRDMTIGISRQTQHVSLWPLCPLTQSGCYLSTGETKTALLYLHVTRCRFLKGWAAYSWMWRLTSWLWFKPNLTFHQVTCWTKHPHANQTSARLKMQTAEPECLERWESNNKYVEKKHLFKLRPCCLSQ